MDDPHRLRSQCGATGPRSAVRGGDDERDRAVGRVVGDGVGRVSMMKDLVLDPVLSMATDVGGGSGEIRRFAAVGIDELAIEALDEPRAAPVLDRPPESDTDRPLGEFRTVDRDEHPASGVETLDVHLRADDEDRTMERSKEILGDGPDQRGGASPPHAAHDDQGSVVSPIDLGGDGLVDPTVLNHDVHLQVFPDAGIHPGKGGGAAGVAATDRFLGRRHVAWQEHDLEDLEVEAVGASQHGRQIHRPP